MIITIGRQHGSNGHDIARLLADELGYRCYDKEIIDHAAENSDFSKEIFTSYDEKRVAAYIAPTPHYIGMNEGFRLNMQVASAQFEAIRNLADKDNGVFLGRCADYVLRNRPNVVKVFIMADKAFRINTMMSRRGLSQEQAKKLIKEVDKDRSSFYRYYTDQIWGESENYDLCVNSGKSGVAGAAEVIKAYITVMESQKAL